MALDKGTLLEVQTDKGWVLGLVCLAFAAHRSPSSRPALWWPMGSLVGFIVIATLDLIREGRRRRELGATK
jgi:hypothetical protein